MRSKIHAAGSDLMQQRLPEMGVPPVDQSDMCLAAFAQLVAEPRHQLKSAGTAANDYNAMHTLGHAPTTRPAGEALSIGRPTAAVPNSIKLRTAEPCLITRLVQGIEARAAGLGQDERLAQRSSSAFR